MQITIPVKNSDSHNIAQMNISRGFVAVLRCERGYIIAIYRSILSMSNVETDTPVKKWS